MGVDFLLRNAKKIIIFSLIFVLFAAAYNIFFTFIGVTTTQILNSFNLQTVSYFSPPNLQTVLTIGTATKTAGTVYSITMQTLRFKIGILS